MNKKVIQRVLKHLLCLTLACLAHRHSNLFTALFSERFGFLASKTVVLDNPSRLAFYSWQLIRPFMSEPVAHQGAQQAHSSLSKLSSFELLSNQIKNIIRPFESVNKRISLLND